LSSEIIEGTLPEASIVAQMNDAGSLA
jgi:hypothetical protein